MEHRSVNYSLAIILGLCALCSLVSADPPYHPATYKYVAVAFLIVLLAQAPILFMLVRFVFLKKEIPLARIVIAGILCTALIFASIWFLTSLFFGMIPFRIFGEFLVIIEGGVIIKIFLNTDNKMAISCSFLMTIPLFLLALMS